jgi:hypothetical protein
MFTFEVKQMHADALTTFGNLAGLGKLDSDLPDVVTHELHSVHGRTVHESSHKRLHKWNVEYE